MTEYDLVVRGGLVASGLGTMRCDMGISGGRIVALAESITGGAATLDAGGLLVLPGGVDTHCHIEEPARGGYTGPSGPEGGKPPPEVSVQEESFATASISAFAGGTTSVVCFVPQWKGEGILPRLADYEARAARGMLDYSFHQIISDPTDAVLEREIPEIVAKGIRSLKVFLTYKPLHLSDAQFLKVLVAARRNGCLVTVHCENYAAINWRTEALLKAGLTAPKYHAWSRPPVVEREATHRAIALAELVDQPIQVFHPAPRPEGLGRDLSAIPGADRCRHGPARLRGRRLHVQPEPPHHRGTGTGLGDDPPRHPRCGVLRSLRLQHGE
jgi:dihydropyrimidinase